MVRNGSDSEKIKEIASLITEDPDILNEAIKFKFVNCASCKKSCFLSDRAPTLYQVHKAVEAAKLKGLNPPRGGLPDRAELVDGKPLCPTCEHPDFDFFTDVASVSGDIPNLGMGKKGRSPGQQGKMGMTQS